MIVRPPAERDLLEARRWYQEQRAGQRVSSSNRQCVSAGGAESAAFWDGLPPLAPGGDSPISVGRLPRRAARRRRHRGLLARQARSGADLFAHALTRGAEAARGSHRRRIDRPRCHVRGAGADSREREHEPAGDSVAFDGLARVFRAGRDVAAADRAFKRLPAVLLIHIQARSVDSRRELSLRRPKDVDRGQNSQRGKQSQIGSGMCQAFPQCGHLALDCSRMLGQLLQRTRLPCGREKI